MTREEILEKMIDITCEQLQVDREKVKEPTSFVDDLGADSLDLAEIVMEIEGEFDVEMPEGEEAQMKTVGAAVNYLEKKLNEKK